jgi:outer membrane protein assembly factor BamB
VRQPRALHLLPAALVVGIALAAPAAAQGIGGWSQFQQGPGHIGSVSTAPAPPYRVAWQARTGIGDASQAMGLPAPVVSGSLAIVVGRADVTAVDVATGRQAWTIAKELGPSVPAAVVPAAPGGAHGLILYTEGGGDESSSASGSPSPSQSSSASASPVATANACRTPATASPGTPRLVAIDALTRKRLWDVDLPGVSRTGPTVDGDLALVGTDGGSVLAVDLASGSVRWTRDIGDCVDVPIAADGGVAFAAVRSTQRQPPQIVALRESDGSPVWSQPYTPRTAASAAGAPAVSGGVLYVAMLDATVRAVDAGTGVERWATRVNSVVAGAPPVVAGDAIVVVDARGQVYRLDPGTGARVWDFASNTTVGGTPAVAGGTVLVPTGRGDVVAIDLSSGEEVGRVVLGEGAALDLAVTSDAVVVARTGPSAGLVGLVHDPHGTLTQIQSPTVLKPALLFGAWAAAAIPLIALLLFAGRTMLRRMGPAVFDAPGEEETWEGDADPEGDT